MSRLSIYETPWTDLVFENRNKEYGAYQLRKESVKSSFTALFMGLLLVSSIGVVSAISNYFETNTSPEIAPTEWSEPLVVTPFHFQEIKKTEKTALPEVKSQATDAIINKEQLINPVIAHPNEAVQDIAKNTENHAATETTSTSTGIIGNNPTSGIGKDTGTTMEVPKVEDTGTNIMNVAILDKSPEFPGGMKSFYNYISKNFEKPEIDDVNTIKIFVYFVIEKDGSMTNIQIIKDPGYGLGKEAIRVLKSLKTKWNPGIINSKPVRTAYNLPISVEIQ